MKSYRYKKDKNFPETLWWALFYCFVILSLHVILRGLRESFKRANSTAFYSIVLFLVCLFQFINNLQSFAVISSLFYANGEVNPLFAHYFLPFSLSRPFSDSWPIPRHASRNLYPSPFNACFHHRIDLRSKVLEFILPIRISDFSDNCLEKNRWKDVKMHNLFPGIV